MKIAGVYFGNVKIVDCYFNGYKINMGEQGPPILLRIINCLAPEIPPPGGYKQLCNEVPIRGMYVGRVDGSLTYLAFGDSNLKSFVTEVTPNTKYTIKRHGTSDRFRLGGSSRNPSDYSTNQENFFEQVFPILDAEGISTFTTGSNVKYITIYWTNSGETNPMIMLNEGNEALPYEPYES